MACEKSGVPSAQIDADIASNIGRDLTNVSYVHSVNTKTHKDYISIDYDKNYDYIITHGAKEFIYSYNKSTDIWTLEGTNTIATVYELKQELSNASFCGFADGPFQDGFSYEISVIDVDYPLLEVTVSYEIFEGDQVFCGQAILDLNNNYYAVTANRTINIGIVFGVDGIYAKYDW